MKKRITFVLLCSIAFAPISSCKKRDYSPLAITSVTNTNGSPLIHSNSTIKIMWSTFGATKKSRIKFFLELYVKEQGRERYLTYQYLQPTNVSGKIPFTINDSKEELKINVGPDFLYKNGYFKLRAWICDEKDDEKVIGEAYWGGIENTFRIFHAGCTSAYASEKSTTTHLSCAITGVPRTSY